MAKGSQSDYFSICYKKYENKIVAPLSPKSGTKLLSLFPMQCLTYYRGGFKKKKKSLTQ